MPLDARRVTGFDSLRFMMVFLVIVLHASMTYMAFVPKWWYVIDECRSLFFTVLVVFLDSFPMSVLFFLAGYFAPPSFAKRGIRAFLRNKLLHIGVPWILGVVFVAPFFAYATMLALDFPSMSVGGFMREYFIGPFYQQGHYWFLGVLFLFLLTYAVWANRRPLAEREGKILPPGRLLLFLYLLSTSTYLFSAHLFMAAELWLNIGYILYFQPARFFGYLGLFTLGVYGWKARWFTAEGWSPGLLRWTIAAAIAAMFLLGWKFILAPSLAPNVNLILDALFYNALMLSMTFFLLAFSLRFQDVLYPFAGRFAADSYGIYWLHQIVLMPILFAVLGWRIPIGCKCVLAVLVTTVLCRFLTQHVLKRLPAVKCIF